MLPMKVDKITGPHFEFYDVGGDMSLTVRQMYAGPGKVTLIVESGRKRMGVTVDAADLIEAITRLVPASQKL